MTIVLNWPANPESEGVSSYQVYESLNGGDFGFKAGVTVNTCQIVSPPAGIYAWKVRAVSFVGTGGFSPVVNGPGLPSDVGTVTVTVVP